MESKDGPTRTRGVSDLVAFVVVFAVIVTSVGVVYTVGYDSVIDISEGSQSESASRAFEIVTQRLGEIERGNSPGWRGEFDLAGGSVGVTSGAQFEVVVNVTSGSDRAYTLGTGALVYDHGRTEMTYEGGALFRTSGDDAAMVDTPPITCDVGGEGPDRAVVSVVRVSTGGEQSLVSSGTVEIDARHNRTRILYPDNRTGVASASDAGFVNVSIAGTDNADAWGRYFEQSDDWVGDGPYSCQADRVYVRAVSLDIDL